MQIFKLVEIAVLRINQMKNPNMVFFGNCKKQSNCELLINFFIYIWRDLVKINWAGCFVI